MSSRKETKLLMEGWRRYLTEADEQEPSNELRKTGAKSTHLAIFDFDKVLFNPIPSPVPAMTYYWVDTVASLAGTPVEEGIKKARELSVDHTIVILTARAVVDKERLDKAGNKYGDIFNQFMAQHNTEELTDDVFNAKVAELLGFMPQSIIRTNNEFNSAMYKKNRFADIVRGFVKPNKQRHNVKFFDNDKKTFNAVVDVPLQIGDKYVIDYEYYLTTNGFDVPTVTKSTSTEKKSKETTPEEK